MNFETWIWIKSIDNLEKEKLKCVVFCRSVIHQKINVRCGFVFLIFFFLIRNDGQRAHSTFAYELLLFVISSICTIHLNVFNLFTDLVFYYYKFILMACKQMLCTHQSYLFTCEYIISTFKIYTVIHYNEYCLPHLTHTHSLTSVKDRDRECYCTQ